MPALPPTPTHSALSLASAEGPQGLVGVGGRGREGSRRGSQCYCYNVATDDITSLVYGCFLFKREREEGDLNVCYWENTESESFLLVSQT